MNTLKLVGLSMSLLVSYTFAGTPGETQEQKCCPVVCAPTEVTKAVVTESKKIDPSQVAFDTTLSLLDMVPKIRTIVTASGELAEGARKMASGQGITASTLLDVLVKIRTIITTSGELAGIARKVVDVDTMIKKLGALSTYLQQPSKKEQPVMLMLPKLNYSLYKAL